MLTPFNDRRPDPAVAAVDVAAAFGDWVPVSPSGVYRLTKLGDVVPAEDASEFKPEILRRDVIGAKDVTTLFMPMRMGGNTFFEVAVSNKAGAEHIERFTTLAAALQRHAALVKTQTAAKKGQGAA